MLLSEKKQAVSGPEGIANILKALLASDDSIGQEREHFWVLGFNSKNVVQYAELVHLGTLNSCSAHPREVFRMAVAKGVCSIAIGHNHPSGELTPSDPDILLTRKLREAGEILGIKVLDHVIIGNGEGGYFSFMDKGI